MFLVLLEAEWLRIHSLYGVIDRYGFLGPSLMLGNAFGAVAVVVGVEAVAATFEVT